MGSAGYAHKFIQLCALEAERRCKRVNGLAIGPGSLTALQIGDRSDAHAGTLAQLLLA
jgi:hypothetical protein